MADTLASLQRRKQSAEGLRSVVKTMKALAAASIDQYEQAVRALEDYHRTIALGIYASLESLKRSGSPWPVAFGKPVARHRVAIVLGSDQGMVGGFNDRLGHFVASDLDGKDGKQELWAVGERMVGVLSEMQCVPSDVFTVPHSVEGITPIVTDLLVKVSDYESVHPLAVIDVYYNAPVNYIGYEPRVIQLLPLNRQWMDDLPVHSWPTKTLPQVIGGGQIKCCLS